jgi:hypothetical protein
MFRSHPPRLVVPLLLGALFVSQVASAEHRTAPLAKRTPVLAAAAAESLLVRLGRLMHLWAANGAIVDPLGHQGGGTPSATVPSGNPLDDNGAIVDPLGAH